MVATWATVLTAALAAAAAAASWASVWQNRKQIRASLEPNLQVIIEGGRGADHLALHIRNTGGGTAKRIVFVATLGTDKKTIGNLGVGYMPPGHGIHIVFACSGADFDDGDVAVVLISSDTQEFSHAWSHLAGHKVFRTKLMRRHREVTAKEGFAHFFPELSLEGRASVGFHWKQLPPGGMLEVG